MRPLSRVLARCRPDGVAAPPELRLFAPVLRQGLAQAKQQPAQFFDSMAARMIDAQAPGVARRLRALPITRSPSFNKYPLPNLPLNKMNPFTPPPVPNYRTNPPFPVTPHRCPKCAKLPSEPTVPCHTWANLAHPPCPQSIRQTHLPLISIPCFFIDLPP